MASRKLLLVASGEGTETLFRGSFIVDPYGRMLKLLTTSSLAAATLLCFAAPSEAFDRSERSLDSTHPDWAVAEVSPAVRMDRAARIRDTAAEAGMYNAVLLAGIGQVETNFAHCWSEATWACQGPASSSCDGGPVIAGASDGPEGVDERQRGDARESGRHRGMRGSEQEHRERRENSELIRRRFSHRLAPDRRGRTKSHRAPQTPEARNPKPLSQPATVVSQSDPRYTGNPDQAVWGTWEYHVNTESGLGNLARPMNHG